MWKLMQCSLLSVGLLLTLGANRTTALPGQTADEAAAWIQANPTLRPGIGERLLVRKSDTAAQRFTFRASPIPPGLATPSQGLSIIRSERISLFDMINGVTQERLEESLRVIYGIDIYQDYSRARLVYRYPTPEMVAQARNQNAPLLALLQGELRLGDRYAYWVEVAQNRDGFAYNGQINVLLPQDLDTLEIELRNR